MKTKIFRLCFMASLSALAAGCAGAWNGSKQALSVAEEHPISVDSQVVTLTVGLDADNAPLSTVDKARLRAFAETYLTNGYGPLTISAPSGEGEARVADIRGFLNETGVDLEAINAGAYRAGGGGDRNLILSFTRYVATPPVCGIWRGMRAREYANLTSPNFGCATQNNIAAMVADPHDLAAPAEMTPTDATSRARVFDKYRQGQPTSSAKESGADASLAK